ncbi:hypothetical protein G6705_04635 [Polynucleobacter paneuropaeus]|jgi:hypothetical protein|nr:hypothetical protein [Polynucleobacter paneuropaeus]
MAESVAYQNWIVDITGATTEAHTANDSNSSFGLFCSGDTCLFYVHQNFDCKPGEKYSALVNSGAVSGPISVQCAKINGNVFQILDPFNLVLDASKNAEVIGFAFPLSNGAFTVARFSLAGSADAMKRTLLEASKAKQRANPTPNEPPLNQPGTKGLKDILI